MDKALAFQPGDHVAISFSIAGHEYNGRHFITLRGFKIERAVKIGGESRAVTNEQMSASTATVPVVQPQIPVNPQYDNELPF